MKRAEEWWKLEGEELATEVTERAEGLRKTDPRMKDLIAWRDLYVDAPRDDWQALGLFRDRRARLNAVQNAVDAVHARLARSRTRPWVVTIDGDYEARERAEKASLWLDGQFEKLNFYNLASDVLHDALIFGTGVLKFYRDYGQICVDVRWCGDLFVDQREERFRSVRTLYEVVGVDRSVLAAQHPEFSDRIMDGDISPYRDDTWNRDPLSQSDLVQVVEAWRLPDRPGKAGRHVIVVGKLVLVDEGWTRSTFPFEFLHWSRDPLRFWGVGMVERASGLQAELNLMSATLEESYRRAPPSSVWIEASSQIAAKQINNSPWSIYTYVGSPPTVVTPPAIAADFSAREEQILQRVYELQGVSQLSAQSQKPAGLNSGRALTVHQDIESGRFYVPTRAFADLHIGGAKQMLALANETPDDERESLTVYGGDDGLEEVKYVDAMLGDRPHQIRVFPVSSLSASPEGKIEDIMNLVSLGVITDPADIRELLDFPDLNRYNSVESAGRMLADKLIGMALKGKRVAAHPLLPLEYLLRRGTLEHDLAQLRGADLDKLQNLRDLLGHAESLLPPEPEPELPMRPGSMAPPAGGVPPEMAEVPPVIPGVTTP